MQAIMHRQRNAQQNNQLLPGEIMRKDILTEEDIQFRKDIHLKNLKRKASKLSQYPEFKEEYLELQKQIKSLE